jgi:hypothetical protein
MGDLSGPIADYCAIGGARVGEQAREHEKRECARAASDVEPTPGKIIAASVLGGLRPNLVGDLSHRSFAVEFLHERTTLWGFWLGGLAYSHVTLRST